MLSISRVAMPYQRLVVLPFAPHWYAARESNQQLVYEMLRWFDNHVKDASAGTR